MSIKDFTDVELNAEINRRKNIAHQKEVEKRKKEQEEYNKPENVAARKAIARENNIKSLTHRLTSKGYNLDDYDTWVVKGEDSNCDLGGYHDTPTLGKFEGTLAQVIEKAVDMPRFYSWGGGGDISKAKVSKVEKL